MSPTVNPDDNLDALSRQGVNAQCDQFDAAINAAVRLLREARKVGRGHRTDLRPIDESSRSPQDHDAAYDALNTLDQLAGVDGGPEVPEVPAYRVDLGTRWYQVTHNPAGWPEQHSPVNGHMGNAGQPLCPGLPVWKVERTGPRGRLTGHIGYYCADDLPAEYRHEVTP